jgi:hypothetical protein
MAGGRSRSYGQSHPRSQAPLTGVPLARRAEILEVINEHHPAHHAWLKDAISHAHRKTYNFRIQELLQDTKEVMASVVEDQIEWTKKLVNVRNELGHALDTKSTPEQMIGMLYSARLLA